MCLKYGMPDCGVDVKTYAIFFFPPGKVRTKLYLMPGTGSTWQVQRRAGTSATAQGDNDDDNGGEWTVVPRKKSTRQSTAKPFRSDCREHLNVIFYDREGHEILYNGRSPSWHFPTIN